MALPAFAQEAEPVAPQAANQGIGDIIVTAQKRAQSVNDVGLSITAASGEQLAASGVRDTGDLAKITPGFTFTESQDGRSEEHTSELQSLMRISYAVFCLKKKKDRKIKTNSSIILT